MGFTKGINIEADVVFERLLKFGLFPERLGKILSSEQLGSYSCIKNYIGCHNEYHCAIKKNCDLMIYRQFKSKNIERILEIPHPIAYINASLCIKNHWKSYIQPHLNKVDIKAISMITISQSNKTGRLFEFRNYSGELDVDYKDGRLLSHKSENQDKALQATTINELSLNARYLVKTDISQCYPSMYTHSIPWAAVGTGTAKKNRGAEGLWYNLLDEKIRKMQRAETSGIPIGRMSLE